MLVESRYSKTRNFDQFRQSVSYQVFWIPATCLAAPEVDRLAILNLQALHLPSPSHLVELNQVERHAVLDPVVVLGIDGPRRNAFRFYQVSIPAGQVVPPKISEIDAAGNRS
jgi:hypothetical protein